MQGPTRVITFGEDAISQAATLIAAGGVVAVPTETVYGLAADATNAGAVAAIYAAKGRPSFNPLIVHVADLAAAEEIAIFDDAARDLAARFWPGPLTLVLPLRADAGIAAIVTAGLSTVAVRVPAHRAMRALLAATGQPLAAPSANASNAISPTRAEHVLATLDGRIPLVIDDGACAAGLESTIVSGNRVLRPGPISQETLFPGEGRGPASTDGVKAPRPITAPGQLASHYAPSKPLRLNAVQAEADEYLIGYGAIAGDMSLGSSLVQAAAKLFDALHLADTSSKSRIAVAPVPDEDIGRAINDRLRRAAHRD